MDKVRVMSSTISAVGYDPGSRALEIRFTSGTTYRYSNVPEHCHTSLMNAPSKGSYFNTFIKDRYMCMKVL